MSSQHALTNRGDACLRDVHSTGTSLRASIEMKRHSLTFPCARTRLLLSMQHEKHSERLHPDQSGQATHQAMPLAHPTPWVLACDPLSHACLRHMLTDVTRVASQLRLNATLSRTCSKPHHLAFRMSLHAPKHRRQNARLACARTRTPLSKQREAQGSVARNSSFGQGCSMGKGHVPWARARWKVAKRCKQRGRWSAQAFVHTR